MLSMIPHRWREMFSQYSYAIRTEPGDARRGSVSRSVPPQAGPHSGQKRFRRPGPDGIRTHECTSRRAAFSVVECNVVVVTSYSNSLACFECFVLFFEFMHRSDSARIFRVCVTMLFHRNDQLQQLRHDSHHVLDMLPALELAT